MKTTRYFDERIRPKRPYLRDEWLEQALLDPLGRSEQEDGRIRFWFRVEPEAGKAYVLRVVTLADAETIHNAFYDRGYREADA